MCERISIPIPDDLRFVPHDCSKEWKSDGFLETQSALDVWNNVQKAVSDDVQPGLYLDGPVGTGKSLNMYYVVPTENYSSWFDAFIDKKMTLKFLVELLDRLHCDLLGENDVEVLFALDDSQDLF
jgi:predicted ATPase